MIDITITIQGKAVEDKHIDEQTTSLRDWAQGRRDGTFTAGGVPSCRSCACQITS